jgi:hypothetical protein
MKTHLVVLLILRRLTASGAAPPVLESHLSAHKLNRNDLDKRTTSLAFLNQGQGIDSFSLESGASAGA